MRRIEIILITILLCLAHLTNAQQPNFRFINFSYLDGIPDKAVYAFAQDSLGFLWLGTASGLYRFDGHQFKHFKSEMDNDDKQISNILANVIYDPTYHRLWLKSLNDFQYFDLKNYTFHRVTIDVPFELNFDEINQLTKVQKDILWITSLKGIFPFDIKTNIVKEPIEFWQNVTTIANQSVVKTMVLNDSIVAIALDAYLIFYNQYSQESKVIPILTSYGIRDIVHDSSNNQLLLACFKEIITINLDDLTQSKLLLFDKNQNPWEITNANNLAFIAEDVMLYSRTAFNLKTKIIYQLEGSEGIYDDQILYEACYYTDNQNNLWRGSYESVCSVLPFQNKAVVSFQAKNLAKGSLEVFSSLYLPSANALLIGGNEMKGFLYINTLNKKHKYISRGLDPRSKFTSSIIKTKDGKIYGADDYAMYRIDTVRMELLPLVSFNRKTNDQKEKLNKILQFSDFKILIHTTFNNYLYDIKSGNLSTIGNQVLPKQTLLYPLCILSEGSIYYGSEDGIYFQKSVEDDITKVGFSANSTTKRMQKVTDIKEDRHHQLWIGTLTNGIFVYNPESGEKTNLNKDNSLLKTDFIQSIAYNGLDEIIAGTPTEIYRIEINNKIFTGVFKKQNGFSRDDQSYGVNIQDNQWLIKNNYGSVDILDLHSYAFNLTPRKVVLTSFVVIGTEDLRMPIARDTAFSLKNNEATISFSFASLNMMNSNQETYRFKLEGLDSRWQYTSNPNIKYARLPSGKYSLKLFAMNNDGIESIRPLTIDIKIKQDFYKTWWFILTTMTGLFALGYFYYKQKIDNLLKQQKIESEYEKKLSKIEMKALRAQMNPHFIFNSLNSIQNFIFKKDEYLASQYLTKFSRLIRLILDHSNQEFIYISQEIEHLKLYLEMESLRFDGNFEYQIYIDSKLNLNAKIPSMIIQPHVENSIWHGLLHKDSKGKVTISILKKDKNSLTFIIEDNGVGRIRATEFKSKEIFNKKSFGSAISFERIRLFNEANHVYSESEIIDVYDEHKIGIGTKVIINIAYLKRPK